LTSLTTVAAGRAATKHLKLTHDAIDLWLLRPEEVQDGPELERCRSILSSEELARERRFLFARDRRSFVITRAFVRTVLGHYIGAPPDCLNFKLDANSRPYLVEFGANISFNLAHTRGLVLLGVASDRALGVDVESLQAKGLSDIAEDILAPDEIASLDCLGSAERHDRHFEHWTLKEAYAKARSIGLGLPFRHCAFLFKGDRISFATKSSVADPASRWHFWQFRVDGVIVAAVCGEVNAAGHPSIDFKALPGFPEVSRPFEVSYIRSSLSKPRST